MTCQIIRDLLPLYMDECCSEESAKLVAAHLEGCPECRRISEAMGRTPGAQPVKRPEIRLHSISSWKASLLQSVMLFLSFAILTLGVILEGSTPAGKTNGLWAAALIVPATGYLLSLSSWFFLRVYRSRRAFSRGCCITTAAITLLGYLWAALHYAGGIDLTSPLVWFGAALSVGFCGLSAALSGRYALLSGRE